MIIYAAIKEKVIGYPAVFWQTARLYTRLDSDKNQGLHKINNENIKFIP
jgi:hypothetical protein